MYSSTTGIVPSLVIAGLALLASLLLRLGRLSAFHAVGAGAAALTASFSLLNLAVQPSAVTIALLSKELEDGTLALRVISITAASAFVRLMIAGAKEESFFLIGDPYGDDVNTVEKEEYRRRQWPPEQILNQASVLLLILCLLWALPLLSRASLLIALLNWAYAFTVDDFFMAASYRVEREVRPPKIDGVMIWIWRTLTLVLFGLVMFQQFSWWLASLISGFVIFLLAQPSFARAWHLFKYTWETLGIDPFDSDITTVEGVVIRLFREQPEGPGKIVVLGASYTEKITRRYHMDTDKKDYALALRAHRDGLKVVASGDLSTRGTYRFLKEIRSFTIVSKLCCLRGPPGPPWNSWGLTNDFPVRARRATLRDGL
jgi:hypothetical protein